MNPALFLCLLYSLPSFAFLPSGNNTIISVHTIISRDFLFPHLMCIFDRSVKLEQLCPGPSVTINELSPRFMSDMSDVNIIT